MRALLDRCRSRIAPRSSSIILHGESGVGKGHVAERLHAWSGLAGPLVHVNCAAVPESLAEAQLFGHARGAFTGAVAHADGAFQRASGGTLFLDELDAAPLWLQAKLLVAVESGAVTRVGGREEPVRVRIVAGMQGDPWQAVADGVLRHDLAQRLATVSLRIPPLRERLEDIVPLAERFADEERVSLHPSAHPALLGHPWPGNVRELRRAVAAAAIEAAPGPIRSGHLDLGTGPSRVAGGAGTPLELITDQPDDALRQFAATLDALVRTGFALGTAAASMGISRSTLGSRLRTYGLAPDLRRRLARVLSSPALASRAAGGPRATLGP